MAASLVTGGGSFCFAAMGPRKKADHQKAVAANIAIKPFGKKSVAVAVEARET
jgi:hypothetical protein